MTSRLTGVKWAAVAAAVAASAALVPGIASAADEAVVPTEKITVAVNTVNGSGCPAGTVSATPLGDNTGFQLKLDNTAFVVNSATPRKNCQVNLNVNIPGGFTFAIARSEFSGRGVLAAGARALLRTNYYVQAEPGTITTEFPIEAPLNGTWRQSSITEVAELVWAPCGTVRNVNLNTELLIVPTSTKDWVGLRSQSSDIYTLINFEYKKC